MYLKLVLEKLKPNAFEGRLNDKVGGGGGGYAKPCKYKPNWLQLQ